MGFSKFGVSGPFLEVLCGHLVGLRGWSRGGFLEDLGGILAGLGAHLGWSWEILEASWEGLGRSWERSGRARGAKTEKMLKKREGEPPQGGGLGDPLHTKIDARREGIEEMTDQAES